MQTPRIPRLFATVLLVGGLVAAGGTGAAEPAADLALDQRLQDLKQQSLDLNRELLAAEQALLYPEQSRTSIYVAVKIAGFMLDRVSVRINEEEPVVHRYTDSESRALLSDGWHRIVRRKLDPGSHRLQAEFTGHFFDARAGDKPVTGKMETVFEKGLAELDLVVPVARNTRLDKPGLSELSRLESSRPRRALRNVWLPQPERYESVMDDSVVGTLNDPRLRVAKFLRQDLRFLSALTELLDISAGVADPEALPAAYKLLLADCYLGFGLHQRAQAIYTKLSADDVDVEALGKSRLALARFAYQRGYTDQAAANLKALGEGLPKSLRADWRLLSTEVALTQGRPAEAVALLEKLDKGDLTPVLRYNLGVALIGLGRDDEGRRRLDEVGTMELESQDDLSLRDKANLTLGYQYLRAQRGAEATEVFGRIRTAGPFSNQALLGMGWAEVAPVTAKAAVPPEALGKNTDDSLGTLLRPDYIDSSAKNRATAPPPKPGVPQDLQDTLRRALIPWTELAKRDPMQSPVQEGLLAIPWALDRLQAYEQSLGRYLEAINALETARKRMDEAMKSIRGGRMVTTLVQRDADAESGWYWRVRDLPDAPETFFLQSLLAEHRFQEGLKNFRDARLLQRTFEAWNGRLDALGPGGGQAAVGAAAAKRQVERARQGWQPTWAGTPSWLALAPELGAPGAFDAPLSADPSTPVQLQALDPPAQFDGVLEQLRPLRDRASALVAAARAAGASQDAQLKQASIAELEGQKKVIERYLTEARFAVARIYDRQLQNK